jgi:hypothetical protein
MIRKLKSGEFRLYSRKNDASTGKRRNLGDLFDIGKGEAARARGAVFQEERISNHDLFRSW